MLDIYTVFLLYILVLRLSRDTFLQSSVTINNFLGNYKSEIDVLKQIQVSQPMGAGESYMFG